LTWRRASDAPAISPLIVTMVRCATWLLMLLTALVAIAAWLISVPMVENWAGARAAAEPLAQYEARGFAVAALWLARVAGPVLLVLACLALRAARRLEVLAGDACREFVALTRADRDERRGVRLPASWAFRICFAVWMVLAASHGAGSIRQRLADWPIYRWNDGAAVLPNMSESNRDVIRYLEAATPEDARILVVSDQTLFFVSYYLLPRRVFTKTHPDADRVIPQPNQERQLAAYRLSDLSPGDIDRIDPDFILEYFEGPAYTEPERVLEDANWIAFVRQLHRDASYVPRYNVVLRRWDGETPSP
jgi:hypothetical protein